MFIAKTMSQNVLTHQSTILAKLFKILICGLTHWVESPLQNSYNSTESVVEFSDALVKLKFCNVDIL